MAEGSEDPSGGASRSKRGQGPLESGSRTDGDEGAAGIGDPPPALAGSAPRHPTTLSIDHPIEALVGVVVIVVLEPILIWWLRHWLPGALEVGIGVLVGLTVIAVDLRVARISVRSAAQ